MLKLSPRLMTIAELAADAVVLADIGTDHAYLPAYLILKGRCTYAIASDIKKGPLRRAAQTAERYNVKGKISLRLGAGLDTITVSDRADTIVIAGMGGLAIADILKNGADIVSVAKRVILQPMTMVPELREYVYSEGLGKITERLAFERSKIYNIINIDISSPAEKITLTPAEAYIGKALFDAPPEGFSRYLDLLIKKLERKIVGLGQASLPESKHELKAASELLNDVTYEYEKENICPRG